jgi:hypothetical protein
VAISKKIRFEVFKRDGFTCAYCGKAPPDIVLEVDHIEPKSKGGGDGMENLVTSCFECNRGKKHIQLDKVPPKILEQMEIMKEMQEQLKAYRYVMQLAEETLEQDIIKIDDVYHEYFDMWRLSDHFKNVSLRMFLKKIDVFRVKEAMIKACNVTEDSEKAIKYFCGICWKIIKGTDKR